MNVVKTGLKRRSQPACKTSTHKQLTEMPKTETDFYSSGFLREKISTPSCQRPVGASAKEEFQKCLLLKNFNGLQPSNPAHITY